MERLYNLLLSILLFAACFITTIDGAVAQNTQNGFLHKGVVTDINGEPMVGATIVETRDGATGGAVTNLDGEFEIKSPMRSTNLQITYLGYMPVTKKSTAETLNKIELVEEASRLDDVVVIGYGVVRKSDLTGAVGSLKSDVMEDRQVSSIEDALRGQLAGVVIKSTDGAPGADLNIQIRGASSINASTSPLYVIDGVLMDSTDISPSEIESMEILKDASSTAIYGSRGANGVVVITTKQGKSGRANINFSSIFTIQQPVNLYEMMNSEQFAKYCRWGYGSWSSTGTEAMYDLEGNIVNLATSGNTYINRYNDILSGDFTTDTDWQDAAYDNAVIQDYRLTISGGGDKNTYSVMGSYYKQDGIISPSGMERYNLRANLTQQVNSWLKMGLNVSGSSQTQDQIYGNIIKSILQSSPMKSLYYSSADSTDSSDESTSSPLRVLDEATYTTSRFNVTTRGWFDMKFSKVFRLNVSGSYSYNRTKVEQFIPSSLSTSDADIVNGIGRINTGETTNWLNENLLYITPAKMGQHKLDAMVGMTLQGTGYRYVNTESNDFESSDLGVDAMEYGLVPVSITNGGYDTSMVSGLGRINYSFKDRYLFTATMRADGSSRFAEGSKWGYFPSAAFAWRAGEEEFIKKLGVFSSLKFRASAGMSGNTAISAYQTMSLMSTSNYPMDGEDLSFGLTADRTENSDLTWEKTTQYDAGVDMGFFNNRLTVTSDVYYKRTSDMLIQESVPSYLGYTSQWTNRGILDSKGFELTLSGVPISTKKFSWNSSLNVSINRTNVVYISESGEMIHELNISSATNFGIIKEGQPLGLWYGYEEDGVFTSQSEIDASGLTSIFGQDIEVGYTKYTDTNGDNVIDENDRQVIGCAEAKFTGGFVNTFKYRNVELMIGLEFQYGGDVYNSTRMTLETSKGTNYNRTARAAEYGFYQTLYYSTGELYFQGNEDTAYIRTPVYSSEPMDNTCSSLYIEDASYLRISDLTLAYNFPKKWLVKAKIKNLRVFASVKNLYTFTGYTGYDPDVNSTSAVGSSLMPGLDNFAYPRTRNYSVGASLNF